MQMRREYKILLIVFGSLFGLFLITIVALVVFVAHYGPEIAKNAADPVAAKRTAEKIATFDIPKGYHIGSAMDLKFSQLVSIVPNGRDDSGFQIQLQATMTPSRPDSQLEGAKIGMRLVSNFVHCDLKDAGTDDIIVRGVDVKLNVLQCAGTGPHMRVETGDFPGNAPQATVSAMGIQGQGFDEKALRELLQSVR
jgi:hypothetical protein